MKKTIIILATIITLAAYGCKRGNFLEPQKCILTDKEIMDSLIYLAESGHLTGMDTVWFNGEPYTIIVDSN